MIKTVKIMRGSHANILQTVSTVAFVFCTTILCCASECSSVVTISATSPVCSSSVAVAVTCVGDPEDGNDTIALSPGGSISGGGVHNEDVNTCNEYNFSGTATSLVKGVNTVTASSGELGVNSEATPIYVTSNGGTGNPVITSISGEKKCNSTFEGGNFTGGNYTINVCCMPYYSDTWFVEFLTIPPNTCGGNTTTLDLVGRPLTETGTYYPSCHSVSDLVGFKDLSVLPKPCSDSRTAVTWFGPSSASVQTVCLTANQTTALSASGVLTVNESGDGSTGPTLTCP
jgi:hypothetical protein